MTHPRDHVLALAAQLASTMTTLTNVTAKVRVNGAAATTYTNVSTPAITQNGDIAYGYELKIPANTYSDGDNVEVTWLYSATAYAYEAYTITVAAVDGAHYTTTRGDNLANLDAAVSSRATVSAVWAAVVDSPGVTTMLARITATRAGLLDNLSNLDATITGIPSTVWSALTSGLSTVGSIGKLLATNLDATISSRNAVTPDNADIQSLRADITTARAAKLDLIGSASITFTGPVLSGGGVVVYQGDDYYNADGRALSWTSSSFPTLTGATISFQLRNGALTKAGVVSTATSAYVELAHTDLASLTPSQAQQYTLIATLSNGHVVTLAQGPFLCETRP